mmetsp:Transcript_76936/g.152626  ORF Transcript_76936/g.152626 Transcript_76936/m.152626 type:complete len:101 (+) Transcript_76936:517-819(+)
MGLTLGLSLGLSVTPTLTLTIAIAPTPHPHPHPVPTPTPSPPSRLLPQPQSLPHPKVLAKKNGRAIYVRAGQQCSCGWPCCSRGNWLVHCLVRTTRLLFD